MFTITVRGKVFHRTWFIAIAVEAVFKRGGPPGSCDYKSEDRQQEITGKAPEQVKNKVFDLFLSMLVLGSRNSPYYPVCMQHNGLASDC